MARRTFIRVQLRKSSCVRVHSVLVLFSKKSVNRFHQMVPEIQESRQKFHSPSCVRVEILADSIPSIHLSNRKTALDYLYLFLSFSVHNFCARTDGQTFFEKVFFFLPDQEYIYMFILRLFFKFHPHSDQSQYTFFPVEMGMSIDSAAEMVSNIILLGMRL